MAFEFPPALRVESTNLNAQPGETDEVITDFTVEQNPVATFHTATGPVQVYIGDNGNLNIVTSWSLSVRPHSTNKVEIRG